MDETRDKSENSRGLRAEPLPDFGIVEGEPCPSETMPIVSVVDRRRRITGPCLVVRHRPNGACNPCRASSRRGATPALLAPRAQTRVWRAGPLPARCAFSDAWRHSGRMSRNIVPAIGAPQVASSQGVVNRELTVGRARRVTVGKNPKKAGFCLAFVLHDRYNHNYKGVDWGEGEHPGEGNFADIFFNSFRYCYC